jgi:class 3 adenylate cyclase
MPLYMDIHRAAGGFTQEDLEAAHLTDLEIQDRYGARYVTYWWNRNSGHLFCLVEAPTEDAAAAVHRDGHGFAPDALLEVEPSTIESMMHIRGEDLPYAQMIPGTREIDSGLRAIMFTDIAGSTAMLNELGDDAAMRHVASHNRILSDVLSEWGGRRVKPTGDGILATFGSVSRAVACTVAIQKAFAEHNASKDDGPAFKVKIGLSAGEPVDDSDDLFGVAVNLAARVCDYAEGGCIFTVNVVKELSIGKGYNFIDRGHTMFKGFADPVQIFEIDWRSHVAAVAR